MSISIEQAIALVCGGAAPLEAETLSLDQCLGRVTAQAVAAPISQPPFDRSPLDGYALRAEDLQGACKENPARLPVTARYFAGDHAAAPLAPGCAARVMTGAMLPPGCDCVVPQEDTDYGEETVSVFRQFRTHANYVFAGEDFCAGETLLSQGLRLDAAALAAAASAGIAALPVRQRPTAAILSTGDELTAPGTPLPPGRIYDANASYLTARLEELGAQVVQVQKLPDDQTIIAKAIRAAAARCQLVVTTGGVSVGQKDLIPAALSQLSADVQFHGIAIKPGMPALAARLDGTQILGLSGNPFSSAVSFELLAGPLLHCWQGRSGPALDYRQAELRTAFPKASPVRRYLRGYWDGVGVTLPKAQSNGQMCSMIGCNCLVELPAGSAPVPAGTKVKLILL